MSETRDDDETRRALMEVASLLGTLTKLSESMNRIEAALGIGTAAKSVSEQINECIDLVRESRKEMHAAHISIREAIDRIASSRT